MCNKGVKEKIMLKFNKILLILVVFLLLGVNLSAQKDFSKTKSIRALYMDGVWNKDKIETFEIKLETQKFALMEKDIALTGPAYSLPSGFIGDGKIKVYRDDPPPTPTAGERENGYILFFRNYLYDIFPYTNPTRSEIDKKEIKVFASLGEYEPIVFSVYPLVDLKNCKIIVSDFLNEKGDKLLSNSFQVNSVMNWVTVREAQGVVVVRAHVLMRLKEIPRIDEGITKQIWINVKIPEDAKGGEYRGKITFAPDGKPSSDIPVIVRVLPFKLMQPPPEVFSWSPWGGGGTTELEKRFIIMKEHGMTGEITDNLGPRRIEGNWTDDYTSANKYMEMAKKVGLPGKFILGNWHCQGTSQYKTTYGPFGMGDSQFNEENYRKLTEMLTKLKKNADENKWLPYMVYLTTELGSTNGTPGDFDKTMKKAKEYYAAARKVVGLKLLATFNRQEELKMHWNLPTIDAIGFNGEMFPEWEAANKQKESWMTFVMSEQRCGYGLYMWKFNFKGCRPWILSDGDSTDSLIYFINNDWHPTVRFERIREGVDDYKYMYTLSELIKQAKAKGKDTQEAEVVVKRVIESIPSVHYKHTDFDYMKLDEFRMQMAEQIMKLLK